MKWIKGVLHGGPPCLFLPIISDARLVALAKRQCRQMVQIEPEKGTGKGLEKGTLLGWKRGHY
jgi:hypothetical protein